MVIWREWFPRTIVSNKPKMHSIYENSSQNVIEVAGELLSNKQHWQKLITGLLCDHYFWYIAILTIFIGIFSYAPDLTAFIGLDPRPGWELDYYVALYRVIFILSAAIAAWRFGIRGGIVTCIILTPIVISPFVFGLRAPNILLEIGLIFFGFAVSFIIGRQGNLQRLLTKTAEELRQQAAQLRLEIAVRMRAEKEIRMRSLAAIESLVIALEAKDKYTAGHSRRVTDIAVAIGSRMKLSVEELEDLRCSSLLHDVGKIAVEHFIQNKPDTLTSHEYEHIMIHVQAGAGIVKPIVNEKVVELIEHHHDYFNGGSLHQTVVGEGIPLGARIIAVADAFDAMTSDRPYRLAMSAIDAIQEIRRCIGAQFDPAVVRVFLEIPLADIVSTSK